MAMAGGIQENLKRVIIVLINQERKRGEPVGGINSLHMRAYSISSAAMKAVS